MECWWGLGNITGRGTLEEEVEVEEVEVEEVDGEEWGVVVFTTRLKMQRHHRHVHLGLAPWQGSHLCEICGKTFSQKIGLRVHRMHKHGDPQAVSRARCVVSRGTTKTKLARHMRTHSHIRTYKCDLCGHLLKTLDTYRNHQTLHNNEGRYRCPVCSKAFNHKQYFDDHCRSHRTARTSYAGLVHTSLQDHQGTEGTPEGSSPSG
ncbi:hypothetical protein Pcinc_016830 [Petrolisthes cinctipes]|uniref:C2H2-type domain-containing protein n=1 Tax=Petrolisthes cinctipes TaxID=88211 RepID=A0AAE1KPD1_PETCI|nr:hypothetical protein Pcinc_016830 [Petrolisthes cinctipes]